MQLHDEDDDAARTNVSKDQVNVTLSTEELFLSTQYKYIALPHNRKVRHEGGRIQMVNVIHSAVPSGFHTSQLDVNTIYKVSNKSGFFYTVFLLLGKTIKLVFLFLAIQFSCCCHTDL
jgi:hypothetical protein